MNLLNYVLFIYRLDIGIGLDIGIDIGIGIDIDQSFAMKSYLLLFPSFTVYPDTCLILSQLSEPGQLFFFRA